MTVLSWEQARRLTPAVMAVLEVGQSHHPACPQCGAPGHSDGGRTLGGKRLEVDYDCPNGHDWRIQLGLDEARALLNSDP
jgi:hypothetical protein